MRMNIWVIGRSYPSKSNNMIGSFELEQAHMLAKQGHSVVYMACVFHPIKKIKKWGYQTWNEQEVTVCTYSQFYTPERFQFHWKKFKEKRWKELLAHAEGVHGFPDVIHIHFPTMITEPEVFFDYQAKGTKIVVTEHWSKVLLNELTAHQKHQLFQYVKKADTFICVSDALQQAVRSMTDTKREIMVIPNVAADIFKSGAAGHKKDTFQFIAVGRLVPLKQFDRIIKAFALAFKGRKSLTLTIVGGGKMLKDLKRLSEVLSIQDQVEFTGTLPRQEVAQKMSQADALICFSKLETFGVPVIEAWSCGIPVIGFTDLPCKNYFNDALGILVDNNSEEELAEAMQTMEENREKYSKRYISHFAKENFSEEAIYRDLMKAYR